LFIRPEGLGRPCYGFVFFGDAFMNLTEDARAAASSDDPRLVGALEEYRALLDAGRKPSRQEFLARYPDIKQALADCLDGLEFIHTAAPQLHPPSPGISGPAASLRATGDIQPEAPLGDYRIIREIGRGGMGVVYEAVQISLGRRVASAWPIARARPD
jgi:hypothetical protein